MCGSWADAEDIVQQVAIEWLRTTAPVDNAAGWLTTVTVRRALDQLRARQRDAAYVGPWLPEPVIDTVEDPDRAIERAESLSTAFLMLAEALTPPQRATIVLRALDYSHTEIARIIQITPAASRQHYTRARRRLAELDHHTDERECDVGRPALAQGPSRGIDRQARVLLETFLTAARTGDVELLTEVLHDQVQAYQDGGGNTRAARRVLVGTANVARFAIGVAALHQTRHTVRFVTVNGAPGAVVTLSGIVHVLSVQVRDGRIYRLFDVCNPDKHRALPTAVEAADRLLA